MARAADCFDWMNEGETTEQLSAPRRSVTKGQTLRPSVGGVDGRVVKFGHDLARARVPEQALMNHGC